MMGSDEAGSPDINLKIPLSSGAIYAIEYGVWAYSSSPTSSNGPATVSTRMNRTYPDLVDEYI